MRKRKRWETNHFLTVKQSLAQETYLIIEILVMLKQALLDITVIYQWSLSVRCT